MPFYLGCVCLSLFTSVCVLRGRGVRCGGGLGKRGEVCVRVCVGGCMGKRTEAGVCVRSEVHVCEGAVACGGVVWGEERCGVGGAWGREKRCVCVCVWGGVWGREERCVCV